MLDSLVLKVCLVCIYLSFNHVFDLLYWSSPTRLLSFLLFLQSRGAKGPIFEDGPNFDRAFKIFHGKDGVVPLSERPYSRDNCFEPQPASQSAPQFNPLAAKAATISLTGFGPGWPFGFDFFNKNRNNQKKNSGSSKNKDPSSKVNLFD